jgi:hypothetical protein
MSDDRSSKGDQGEGSDGLSKEEWLRQNPGQATDPEGEQVDEGMTKEEYLRKIGQSGGDGEGAGGGGKQGGGD